MAAAVHRSSIVASAKGVAMAPRKISLVASLVRGRNVSDALVILSHTPKRAARPLYKLVASAKASSTFNHGLDEKSLVISRLQVTAGSRLKRYRAGAKGSAKPYQRRTSHIAIEISGNPVAVKAAAKPKAKEK